MNSGGRRGRGGPSGRSVNGAERIERSLLVSAFCAGAVERDRASAREHRTIRLQSALCILVPGTSAGSINPHFFQPVDNNRKCSPYPGYRSIG